jgi:hypothetical protein
MSSGVSQIEYWREPRKPVQANETNTKNIKEGGSGATYLSYDVFLGLSVIGGILALDHLYLRSPMTFLAKLIINILFLGVWWLYDASQAVFNKDTVKVFGLGVPGMGPKGIAAGVLGSDVPDKKHMAFFIYGLAIMLGGLFGLDSFVVGDKQSGFIRIVCLITGILAPVAIFWWLYNLIMFFFKTKSVTNTYWEYFGAPKPADHGLTIAEKILNKFPFLQSIFGPISRVKETIVSDAEALGEGLLQNPVTTIESVIDAPLTFVENKADSVIEGATEILTGPVQRIGERVSKIVTNTAEKFGTELKPAIETAIEPATAILETAVAPIKQTINSGLQVAETGLETAKEGILLGRNVLSTGKNIADRTLNVVGETAEVASKVLTLAPAAASLTTGFTPAAATAALAKLQQGGGSSSNTLGYVLLGTVAIIAVSGFIVTYRRSKQNVKPRKDDSPPEPGILRKSDQEKSS